MGKNKINAKYNVVSMRISDEEKRILEELTRQNCTNISGLLREAMLLYTPAIYTVRQSDI
jgi:hypothetical protein